MKTKPTRSHTSATNLANVASSTASCKWLWLCVALLIALLLGLQTQQAHQAPIHTEYKSGEAIKPKDPQTLQITSVMDTDPTLISFQNEMQVKPFILYLSSYIFVLRTPFCFLLPFILCPSMFSLLLFNVGLVIGGPIP